MSSGAPAPGFTMRVLSLAPDHLGIGAQRTVDGAAEAEPLA
jgi:hypothetical protein